MYAITSPPIPASLAALSVIIPFDVEIIAVPRPFNTLGISLALTYTLKLGLLILLRPDITLFINGLPLVFIEVKKTNNIGGMVAEADRMTFDRFPNKKFRRFINITQLMIFSNNMEYSTKNGITPIEGAFYCTGSRKKAFFNCFRYFISFTSS